MLEKSKFTDESQYFHFHADEEMEGTSSKNKQLCSDFKLVENILAKWLLVAGWSRAESASFLPSTPGDSRWLGGKFTTLAKCPPHSR